MTKCQCPRRTAWARLGLTGLVAVLGALCAGTPARVGIFYGSDGFTADLVRIDTSDGSSTVVGHMNGLGNGVGLAYDAANGKMYARDFNNLYTVDVNTAATTLVGASGSGITALAFDPTYSTLYSFDQGNGNFYRVDPNTGAATFVGNTGISVPLDLSTNPFTGVLYGTDINANIYTINTVTGAGTLVAANVDHLNGNRGMTAISWDAAGNLYGVTLNGDELVQINLAGDTDTNVGGPNVRQDIRGMDFIRGASAVPEPTSLALLGVATMGLAGYGWRRRKAAVAA